VTSLINDDPEAEFNEWRAFYAKQFEGDPAMEEYLNNIDAAIAFKDILKENELATIENLVEKCKFLESAETLDKIELPFPWKSPTKERSPPPVTESDPASTTRNEKLEKAGHPEQISHDESPTINGGDNQTPVSPFSIIHIGRDERPPTVTMTDCTHDKKGGNGGPNRTKSLMTIPPRQTTETTKSLSFHLKSFTLVMTNPLPLYLQQKK
jgi:hypothetical protein